MAFNPKDLTVDYKSLLKLTSTERMKAAQDPQIGPSLLAGLTPTQYAALFPQHFRKELGKSSVGGTQQMAALSGGSGRMNDAGGGGIVGGGSGQPSAPSSSTTRPTPAPSKNLIPSYKKKLEEATPDIKPAQSRKQQSSGGGSLKSDENGKINPVQFYDTMKAKVEKSDIVGTVPSWGPKFGIKTGSSDEWARLFTMIQQQESGHRVAQTNPDGTLKRFATTKAGENSFGPGQFNVKEYGLKTWQDVNDPDKVQDAYINVAKKNKMLQYFGGMSTPQRYNEINKHSNWFETQIKPFSGKTLTTETKKEDEKVTDEKLPTTADLEKKLPKSLNPAIKEDFKKMTVEEQNTFIKRIEKMGGDTAVPKINEWHEQEKKAAATATPVRATGGVTPGPIKTESGYISPITGKMLHDDHGGTSHFGWDRLDKNGKPRLHGGVDIFGTDPETGKLRVGDNAPVTAPANGRIIGIHPNTGDGGNIINMMDDKGRRHDFMHVSASASINPETNKPFKAGDKIKAGQQITTVTGSGTAYGRKLDEFKGDHEKTVAWLDKNKWQSNGPVTKPHLHYEVRENDKKIDPAQLYPDMSKKNKSNMMFSNEAERERYMQAQGISPQQQPTATVTSTTQTGNVGGGLIPNQTNLPTGGTSNKPFDRVLTHISGHSVGSKNVDTGRPVQSTTEELGLIKGGRYTKPNTPTAYGYHTAVASNYIDKNGNKIDETAYDKLPDDKKKLYEEKAELHQIRPMSARPWQARGLNDTSYGIVTVGKTSQGKTEAVKEHMARLYAEGKLSEQAIQNTFGHGELQTHGGRATLERGGPEGAPMAIEMRKKATEIVDLGNKIKLANQSQSEKVAQNQPPPTPEPPIPEMEHGGERAAQGDNAYVISDTGKPLFKMNTDKERMSYDPGNSKLKVEPVHRNDNHQLHEHQRNQDARTKQEADDRASSNQVQPQQQQQPAQQQQQPRPDNSQWEKQAEGLRNGSSQVYETQSFKRAMARTRFDETGDSALGGHYSLGSSNMRHTV